MEVVWSPICSKIEELLQSQDSLTLLIAPYIKKEALERLLRPAKAVRNLRVVVRWSPRDLVAGVSDLTVYDYLQDIGVPLYYNHAIHLKLFVFESNYCLATSANITHRGLGYIQDANIEAGALVRLDLQDWEKLYGLLANSRLVDSRIYESLSQYVNAIAAPPKLPPFVWPVDDLKLYTISALPAMSDVSALAQIYFGSGDEQATPEQLRRAAHDLATFRISPGLNRDDFDERLRASFCRSAFVVDFVEFLKAQRSLRFGAVNDWIHQKCEDVPLPYRWEIKENTRCFYNWLAHFIPEITWDRPNYSQVIYWRGSDESTATDVTSPTVMEHYQELLSNLTNRERATEWNNVAIGGAPHQPLLLLAVTTLYDRNPGRPNLIELNKELEGLFSHYFSLVVNPPHSTSSSYAIYCTG